MKNRCRFMIGTSATLAPARGGEISHLTVNPDNINISKLDLAKEHIKIYEYQMSSPLFKKTTPEFQQLMKKNYSNDKWYYNTYKPK